MKKRFYLHLFSILLLAFLSACGGSSGGGSLEDSTGTVSVALTDAATDDYQAVYVTIDRIDVLATDQDSESGTWVTVAEPAKTYNLLDLVNGVFASLGQEIITTGTYGQLRLIIGEIAEDAENILDITHPYANYVIDQNDESHELKVPSGLQTGLKITSGFEIYPGGMTELILDFDASRSVVKAGNSGKYLLKPTIKILEVTNSADIYGIVSEADSDPLQKISEALISAQETNSDATDSEDMVSIVAGTVTTDDGEYALVVAPGSYNVVARATGYQLACQPVTIDTAETSTLLDLSLTPLTETEGNISGTISFDSTDEDLSADISVRQEIDCGETPETVIVKTIQIAAGGQYTVELPAGDYTLVATAEGYETQTKTVTVGIAGNSPAGSLDFTFTTTE